MFEAGQSSQINAGREIIVKQSDCRIGQIVGVRYNETQELYELFGRIVQIANTHVDLMVPYLSGRLVVSSSYDMNVADTLKRETFPLEEIELVKEHECGYCACGQVEYSWSDRDGHCFANARELTKVICNWALDHYYDRGEDLPYGLPENVRVAGLRVVDRHLSAIQPDWRNHSVNMDDAQRRAFKAELRTTITQVLNERPTTH